MMVELEEAAFSIARPGFDGNLTPRQNSVQQAMSLPMMLLYESLQEIKYRRTRIPVLQFIYSNTHHNTNAYLADENVASAAERLCSARAHGDLH